MLLSMTGQGQSRTPFGTGEITAEVRAVNNRHLKIQTRTSDGLGTLEPKIESLVRSQLRRGSLQLNVQLSGGLATAEYRLEESVIESYLDQCKSITDRFGITEAVSVSDLLGLPGVISLPRSLGGEVDSELESAVLATVTSSIENLNSMRLAEGQSMATELVKQLRKLAELTDAIERRAPGVVEDYRERLKTRLTNAIADVGVELKDSDLVREVLLMADKADIREELVRLRSHFEQFQTLLDSDESQGRKLDFLIQEMFRETNTIGSKANDAEIAQRVVDLKAIIEQMRELVQNVE